MPWSRSKNTQGMIANHDISQLKRLAKFVVRLIGLVIQNHMNVVAFSCGRILVGLVTHQFTTEIQFDLYGRPVDDCIFGGRNYLKHRFCFVLRTSLLH
jgi:hypothetical protein